VKITGPKESKIGDSVTLSCQSGNSNPKADIAWFKGGVPLEGPPSSSLQSTDGGWTTSGNVTFRIEPTDRKETFTCQAVNRGLGETKSATHTIHVIRKKKKTPRKFIRVNCFSGTFGSRLLADGSETVSWIICILDLSLGFFLYRTAGSSHHLQIPN